MYQVSYSDVVADSPAAARGQERAVFDQAIALLKRAGTAEPHGTAEHHALMFINQLWAVLIKDLSHPENELPDHLRAQLMSIGLWVMREAHSIELGRSRDFGVIAEVCGVIRDGLL